MAWMAMLAFPRPAPSRPMLTVLPDGTVPLYCLPLQAAPAPCPCPASWQPPGTCGPTPSRGQPSSRCQRCTVCSSCVRGEPSGCGCSVGGHGVLGEPTHFACSPATCPHTNLHESPLI